MKLFENHNKFCKTCDIETMHTQLEQNSWLCKKCGERTTTAAWDFATLGDPNSKDNPTWG